MSQEALSYFGVSDEPFRREGRFVEFLTPGDLNLYFIRVPMQIQSPYIFSISAAVNCYSLSFGALGRAVFFI